MRSLIGPLAWLALATCPSESWGQSALVRARPYHARAPRGYDGSRPTPLLLLLHPYSPGGGRQALAAYQLATILDEKGLLLAAPDGTLEHQSDRRFWNATDACCDFEGQGVDDVTYLDAVIADMRA